MILISVKMRRKMSSGRPRPPKRRTLVFPLREVETVLSGHSGGGSLIFGYINAVDQIPDDVVRIAFLDSNYAYDRALGHKDKLVKWLAAPDHH